MDVVRQQWVLQRIDDVSLMCDKRIASLKKLALKPPRPVQTVTPEPAVPLQPPGGAPNLLRRKHKHVFFDKINLSVELKHTVESIQSYFTPKSFIYIPSPGMDKSANCTPAGKTAKTRTERFQTLDVK
uniref:Guanine nucleotide exchange factor DBS-like spectrin-like domain-containing protein n=1 Tax=Glossina austeni TaxID=7395 RepID=A0A1A9V230_GLOAU